MSVRIPSILACVVVAGMASVSAVSGQVVSLTTATTPPSVFPHGEIYSIDLTTKATKPSNRDVFVFSEGNAFNNDAFLIGTYTKTTTFKLTVADTTFDTSLPVWFALDSQSDDGHALRLDIDSAPVVTFKVPIVVRGRYFLELPVKKLGPGVHTISLTMLNDKPDTLDEGEFETTAVSVGQYPDAAAVEGWMASEKTLINPVTTYWARNQESALAWLLFAFANQPQGGAGSQRLWETWPSDTQTFQQPSQAWATVERSRSLTTSTLLDHHTVGGSNLYANMAELNKAPPGANAATKKAYKDLQSYINLIVNSVKEEVRHNEPIYNYTIGADPGNRTNLTTHAGLLAFLNANQVDGKAKLNFPATSMETKSDWLDLKAAGIPTAHYSNYYTIEDGGKTYGLVAFHIMSKILPNWFWATFEHNSNPLYQQQFQASNDSFGNKKRAGDQTAGVKAIFSAAGMVDIPWQFYRQARWQIQKVPTDLPGTPGSANVAIASNSITEAPLKQGSCLACHARASWSPNTGRSPAFFPHIPAAPNVEGFAIFDESASRTTRKITPTNTGTKLDLVLTNTVKPTVVMLNGWAFNNKTPIKMYFPKTSIITFPTSSEPPNTADTLDLDKVWSLLKSVK